MKFEEAYLKRHHKTISIDNISFLFKTNKTLFVNELKDNLFCPECEQAQLAYNNASTPYLSAYPKSEHAEWCSLKQEEMSPKKALRFIKAKENKDLIIRQIETVILILDDLSTATTKTSSKPSAIGKGTRSHFKGYSSASERLSRKRIDLEFRADDFNCYKIFYGTVYIKWETEYRTVKGILEEWHKILMWNKKRKFICRLDISPRVYLHIPDNYKKMNKTNCKIGFLASFENDGKTYRKTSLTYSDYLIMNKE